MNTIDWYRTATVTNIIAGERGQCARRLTFQDSLAPLEEMLARDDFAPIFADKELFWLACCKAIHSAPKSKHPDLFSVAISGMTLVVHGREHIIQQIRETLERLREHWAMQQKECSDFTMLLLETPTHSYLLPDKASIDTDEEENSSWFVKFVFPALPALTAQLGLHLTQTKKQISVKYVRDLPERDLEVTELRFTWQKDLHLVYPIIPKKIAARGSTDEAIYKLYLAQKFCDYTLLTKKNQTIKAHGFMLSLYGGTLANLFEHTMKESRERTIDLAPYSQKTIRAFLDYIYLGPKEFFDKFNKEGTKYANLFKIFDLGNKWQIAPLIDTCTNLMSLHLTKSHKESVEQAAAEHNNEHLHQLAIHLSGKRKRS